MKKYIFRGSRLPWDNPTHFEYIMNNLPWDNIGNMLFPDSVIRAVMTDIETEVILIGAGNNYDVTKVDEINNSFDAFVIPMANAFREDMKLEPITKFVKLLKIPCVVTGVGFQGELEPDLHRQYSFDVMAKEFCIAVLDKSSSIGVRGEITRDYLVKHLGLPAGKIDVIGCPSMQLLGGELPENKKIISGEFKIATSMSMVNKNVIDFMVRICNEFVNSEAIEQDINRIKLIYAGFCYGKNNSNKVNYNNEIYKTGRVVSFVNIPSWLAYMKRFNLHLGNRIHGAIASVLSGVPTAVICTCSRIRELAQYHSIPTIPIDILTTDESAAKVITRICDTVDFSSIYKVSRRNHEIFFNFLNRNGLDTIYSVSDYKRNTDSTLVPYDIKMSKIKFRAPLFPLSRLSCDEMQVRLDNYYGHLIQEIENKNKRIQLLKDQIQN